MFHLFNFCICVSPKLHKLKIYKSGSVWCVCNQMFNSANALNSVCRALIVRKCSSDDRWWWMLADRPSLQSVDYYAEYVVSLASGPLGALYIVHNYYLNSGNKVKLIHTDIWNPNSLALEKNSPKTRYTRADWKVLRLPLFLFPGIRRGNTVLGYVKVIHRRVWTCSWTAVAFSILSQVVEAPGTFCHGGWGRRLNENTAEVCDWILC